MSEKFIKVSELEELKKLGWHDEWPQGRNEKRKLKKELAYIFQIPERLVLDW